MRHPLEGVSGPADFRAGNADSFGHCVLDLLGLSSLIQSGGVLREFALVFLTIGAPALVDFDFIGLDRVRDHSAIELEIFEFDAIGLDVADAKITEPGMVVLYLSKWVCNCSGVGSAISRLSRIAGTIT